MAMKVLQAPCFDGEELDPRLEVTLLDLPEYLPEGGHYFDGLHFDERGLVIEFRNGDRLHPRTYEMRVVFSGAFECLRVSPLGVFQDDKMRLLAEKAGVPRPRFWAFSCRYTNYFNWCLNQTLDREYLEEHARHYVLAAAGQLVEVVSVQPPKLFFDGFGMEILEGACREYPGCDLLYDLPEPDTSE